MNYLYRCNDETCKNEFETQQSMKASPLTTCPTCEQETIERVIHSPMAFVRGEAKTLQLLAERNTQKMGHVEQTERFALAEQNKIAARSEAMKQMGVDPAKPPKPVNRKLADLTDRQKEKYIDKGILP